ncbi:MAG: HAMP domain-containing protein [Proteobacteria bacterium]|nr:HAMP domain-containing protein [Pseudomonadota bacterium]MBK9252350.1 HAMP domain-containing protein [Pseudomonadota bacterium]MCC6633088.1 HAMP domain-containing protein [Gammaproteobacteria bacterium]
MDIAPVRRWRGYGFIAVAAILVISVLLLLARSVENSAQFSRWQLWILGANIAGVIVLAVLLARKLRQLVRDYRHHVPGSRLTARTVAMFGALVVVPLLVIYLFSLEFLNRGIDSWFRVEIKQGLDEAVVLSRSALDLRMREQARRTEALAASLREYSNAALAAALDAERRTAAARELIAFGPNGEVIAASVDARELLIDPQIPREMLMQVRGNRPYMGLEPLSDGGYLISTAAPIPDFGPETRRRFLVARQLLPRELADLANAVQHAYNNYGVLSYVREPLKYQFRLALTLVLLLAMLSAIYLAIRSAQLLTKPVHDLIQGTRAVGKGDFETRLPLPSRDEMGFLVQSFNDMTKRLRRASEEANRSRQLIELERERLAVILGGLSTGLLVVDTSLRLRIANEAADSILGTELASLIGVELGRVAEAPPRLAEFTSRLRARLTGEAREWQDEFELPPDRVLRVACAPLADAAGEAGYVVVFDDITSLLHAQRDAAWGEVARRLAHEIRNPLTPIQLAAERLGRRLAGKLSGEDAEILDRATRTIVQQVESMKGMVNAFSEYARAPDLKLARVDLNELVAEAVELYRAQESGAALAMQIDARLPPLLGDRGRLRQVLNNLIANGLEAVEGVPGGRVTVQTQMNSGPKGNTAVIMVTDNGHGFRQEMLARVFEPYVTSKPKGTGLGLAIVKKIAEEHGGSIEADNRPEGGAFVRVVLPLTALQEGAQPARDIA